MVGQLLARLTFRKLPALSAVPGFWAKRGYMDQRMYQNHLKKLPGLTSETMRHHTYLQPLFLLTGFAMAFAVFTAIRNIFYSPDVALNKDPFPQNKFRYRNSKLYNPFSVDFGSACKAPEYTPPQD